MLTMCSIGFVVDDPRHQAGTRLDVAFVSVYSKSPRALIRSYSIRSVRVCGPALTACLRNERHSRSGPPSSKFPTCYSTELTARAMLRWQQKTGIASYYIQVGKPIQNAFVENFNGRLRDEPLNERAAERYVIPLARSRPRADRRMAVGLQCLPPVHEPRRVHACRVRNPVHPEPDPERTLVMNVNRLGQAYTK